MPNSLNYIPTVVSSAILISNWTIWTLPNPPSLRATIPTPPLSGLLKERAKDRVGREPLNNVPISLVIAQRLVTTRPVLSAPPSRWDAGKANPLATAAATLHTITANLKKLPLPRHLPVILAPTVVAPTIMLGTATNAKRTKRRNQPAHTNRLINPFLLMKLLSSSLSLFSRSLTPTSTLTTTVMIGGSQHRNKRIHKNKTFQKKKNNGKTKKNTKTQRRMKHPLPLHLQRTLVPSQL